MIKTMLLTCILLTASQAKADIFGADDRRYIYPRGYLSQEAKGVAVGVLRSLWTDSRGGEVDIRTISPVGKQFKMIIDSLSDRMCRGERFSQDPSIPYACTGFLVGPDLLVTAGHCAVNAGEEISRERKGYCEAYTWKFDYQNQTSRPLKTSRYSGNKIFKCKEIIYAINEEGDFGRDFALIRLKRAVPNYRHKFKLGRAGRLSRSSKLSMLGHPMGTPLKLSPNGSILSDHSRKTYIKTNLDALSGNSGSPVLNSKKEVIGVLVGGQPNITTYRTRQGCERYNRCDSRGRKCVELPDNVREGHPNTYSKVQKIDPYIQLISTEKAKSNR